ncbi:extracellular solute-binding protein [Chitinophagaceae bacterium LB-8]|uniref:Extracellular solute-binding protein n=1 Tax=Paraflavisolibacter caeni TaxID=2982496 RepID=A0A9X3B8E5_9BACT|nr:extracellular solute-binding protein [Paraflavisolibacter caeni]MCU7549666.1 extracellular solute-binding protein [Paraflavisolibacter caeni]
MAKTILKGITWGHSRGITPLLAAAQRFNELFPDVEIQWHKRTLQEFADFPIEKLTEQYDLLIIDHPWVGCAAATNCVLPLDQYLPESFLNDQAVNSTGLSHQSYNYKGHQWALAIDAATPAASYRSDLLQKNNVSLPQTWEDVLLLAKDGKLAVPAIPIDLLMNFYTFCIAHGTVPFQSKEEIVDVETGIKALEAMPQLYSLVDKVMFTSNPIAVAEMMSKTNKFWYCPFAYCYSNYSRTGYAENRLTYADVVNFNGQKLRTTIGGTGLSVSAFSKHKEIALQFAEMVTSGSFQSTFYVEHGGQPGYRKAWESETANRLTNDFFSSVLPAMQSGYMRPRYNGYLHFQDTACEPLHQYLWKGGNPETVLQEMNRLYQESLVYELKLQP